MRTRAHIFSAQDDAGNHVVEMIPNREAPADAGDIQALDRERIMQALGVPQQFGTATSVASYAASHTGWYDRELAAVAVPEYEHVDTQAADRRARDLLVRKLSPSQWDQYEQDQTFDVIGGTTGTRYRIRPHVSHNVIELDKKGKPVRSLCAGPTGSVPLGDYLLAQKVWLETDEEGFVKTANKTKL